jgi:predicted PurR-regulated permease PerM
MIPDSPLPKSLVFSLIFASAVVIMAGVKAAEPIITPFIVAMFVAAINAPIMLWLTRHRVPKVVALGLVMSFILAVALILSGLVGTSLEGFSSNLEYYQSRLHEISERLLGWLSARGVDLDMEEARGLFNLSAAMSYVGLAFNRLLGTLSNAFLIFLTVAFILLELNSIGRKIHHLADDPADAMSSFSAFSETLNRYLVIKTLSSLATGACITIILYLFGIDYPVLWGIVAFLLNFVPNIGSIIAAVPAVLMGMIQHDFATAGWIALIYLGVNNIVGNVVEPRWMGRSLGLSTLVVFSSLVFWGWLLGPVGMFLSVPLTMTLKIAFDTNDETRWLAVLLGGDVEQSVVAPKGEAQLPNLGSVAGQVGTSEAKSVTENSG